MVRRLLSVTLSLLALLGLLSGAPAPARAAAEPFLLRWGALNTASDKSFTRADAVAIARNYDLVVAGVATFKGFVADMRAANPRLRLVVYLKGAIATGDEIAGLPEAMFSHDSAGRRISMTKFPDNWLMRPADPGWMSKVAAKCTSQRTKAGYDGCYLDVLGNAPLDAGFGSGLPINPLTGAVFSQADWFTGTSAVGAAVKRADPDAFVIANGLGHGVNYFTTDGPASQLLDGVDAGNAEHFMRLADAKVADHKVEDKWRQDVDMLVDAGRRGRAVMAMTKVWVPATQAEVDAWHELALASFLLGTDGRSHFLFSSGVAKADFVNDSPWDHVDVGTPVGAYAKIGSVYQRSFEKGRVLVNPTAAPVAVSLGGTFRGFDGTPRTTITLGAYAGAVLLKA